jgi:hypothetical protein
MKRVKIENDMREVEQMRLSIMLQNYSISISIN